MRQSAERSVACSASRPSHPEAYPLTIDGNEGGLHFDKLCQVSAKTLEVRRPFFLFS